MSGPTQGGLSAEVAAVLAAHRYRESTAGRAAHCACGTWLLGNAGLTHTEHLAAAVTDILAARLAQADEDRAAALCGQCQELPAVMVKIGTNDGWCTDCLDRAAATPDAGVKALLYAAEEMAAVIADGDVAEIAAPVPGEVGRASAVDRRDRLYEEPHTWLREYAAAVTPGSDS